MSDTHTPIELPVGDGNVMTAAHFDVRRPWDGTLVARVALGDAGLLHDAVTAAHAALPAARRQAAFERAAVLGRIAAQVEADRKTFADALSAEAGKPIALAEAEVDRCVAVFAAAAEAARTFGRQALVADAFPSGAGHTAELLRPAAGVVYGMSPFNFPLNLVAHKLAPAIACGATIVLKPSPRTPLSAIRLAEACRAAGCVRGQVHVVTCHNDDALAPLKDDRVKVVSFTGSADVGWDIKRQAGRRKTILELGGNAAAVVHADADIADAAPRLAAGAFAYAGQSCISVQRVYVHADRYEAFKAALLRHIRENIRAGDPARRDVTVGPMIDASARDRVLRLIESARAAGATMLCGGVEGPCVLPTVLEEVPPEHPVMTEEIFGPVMVLARYDAFDAALAAVNASRYGLQAGVFTRDPALIDRAIAELEVGAVLVNQSPTFRLDHLPYGGVKDSGFGREGVQWAMEEMTEPRVTIRRRW